jgi:glycosyltransferase involved in cell wall biosynthesis
MRVLVSAYACEPGQGSEPGAGWQYVRALSRHHEVWVLTRTNNAEAIESHRHELGIGTRFIYLDLPAWARWWKRRSYGIHVYYLLWQVLAWVATRRLLREQRFDLVHHVTFAIDWMPSGAILAADAPSIWGPVGGVTGVPLVLARHLGVRGVVRELVRLMVAWPLRLVFGTWTARHADLIVAQNLEVERWFRRFSRVIVDPNVVVQPIETSVARRLSDQRVAFYVGRLLPYKGLSLAIRALAHPEAVGWRLEVAGDGWDLARCRSLAKRLGVDDRVRFLGRLPREQVLQRFLAADAMLAPSMFEGSGYAVAEAVALGCPVICLDRGGPAVMVGDGEGVKVRTTRSVVNDLARALISVPARHVGTERWSEEQLPHRLTALYDAARQRRV